jgi:predicted PurR-regulated permease PerM
MGAVQPESGNRPAMSFNWKNISLFLITIGVLYLCGLIALPFLPAITGAIVLARVTAKPYDWLRSRLGMPNVASVLALIAVVFIVILPVSMVVGGIGRHALDMAKGVRSESVRRSIDTQRDQHPRLALLLDQGAEKLDLTQAAQKATNVAAGWIGGLLSNSLKAVIQLVIMLFLLFFLYRDRQEALAALRLLLPLQQEEADYLLGRVSDTIYATVLGRLAVASVQASLAGLAYWALGVPGPFLVWLPIAIYLGLTDHWIKAVIMAVWGGLFISTIDNVLYPALVGSRLRLHAIPIFFSVLGGIALFGVPGLVLGPIVLTIAITLLHIWRKRSAAEERVPSA